MSHVTISRRQLLATSGLVAVGGLSGCLSRVASRVTNTGASPAAVFAGIDWTDDDTEVSTRLDYALGSPHVSRLTPTLSGGSGLLSGDVELEAWVTSVALENYNSPRSNRSAANPDDLDSDNDGVDDGSDDVRGEDYNSPRSNRSIARPVDFFGDDIDEDDEDDETFQTVSRLDARLQEATTSAATAISKRSARTGPNPQTEKEITESVDEMEAVLAEMRAALERCSDDSCVAALANVADRQADARRAQEYAENGEWEAFGMTGEDDDILVGDYLLPSAAFDPSGLFSAAEQAALFRYFEAKPIIAERFSVCLPDAEVPGGNGNIRGAVTPERLFAYLAGQAGDGRVYAWGNLTVASDNSGDCDDTDTERLPEAVCGTSPHFVADVSEPVATGGGLVAERGSGGRVTVVNTPPSADGGAPTVVCPAEGEPFVPAGLDAWGKKMSDVPTTMAHQGRLLDQTVVQVLVQPPGCPQPVPALMYGGRGLSDGQLVYSGGWIIDDAALYENAVTALTIAGETQVVGIDASVFEGDVDGDGFGDLVSRAVSGERARRGAPLDSGTLEELVEAGVLADDETGKLYCWGDGSSSRAESGSCGETDGADGDVVVTHCPLDAPVLHLVNAGRASDEVKFKAGAELSKSVN